MVKLRAGSLILALAACGGRAKASQSMPSTASAASCKEVAAQLITSIGKAKPDLTAEQRAAFSLAIADQCAKDAWSAEARACFATSTDLQSADRCATLLTQPQQDGFSGRMAAETQVRLGGDDADDDAGMAPVGGGGGGALGADPCDGGE